MLEPDGHLMYQKITVLEEKVGLLSEMVIGLCRCLSIQPNKMADVAKASGITIEDFGQMQMENPDA